MPACWLLCRTLPNTSLRKSVATLYVSIALRWYVLDAVSHAHLLHPGQAEMMVNKWGISRTFTRKFFVAAGFLCPAVALTALGFVHNTTAAIALMVTAVGLGGLSTIGWGCNHIDICPSHAGILCGIANTAGTIPGMIGVSVSGVLLSLPGSWALVFITAAVVYLFGAIVFLVFGTGERVID
jgi:hypothetical protein